MSRKRGNNRRRDERLYKALSHPLRSGILIKLSERAGEPERPGGGARREDRQRRLPRADAAGAGSIELIETRAGARHARTLLPGDGGPPLTTTIGLGCRSRSGGSSPTTTLQGSGTTWSRRRRAVASMVLHACELDRPSTSTSRAARRSARILAKRSRTVTAAHTASAGREASATPRSARASAASSRSCTYRRPRPDED